MIADKLSRLGQTIQTMVPSPRGLPSHMLSLAPAPSRPVSHQIQQLPQFVSPVPDLQAWAVDALSPPKVPQHSDKTTEGTQFINNTSESLTCVNRFIMSTNIYMCHDINTNYHRSNT